MATIPNCTQNGIYFIRNIKNGWAYAGSAYREAGITGRLKEHRSDLRKNKHHCIHLQRAWNKYGEDTFSFDVEETCPGWTEEDVRALEQFYLDALKIAGLRYNTSDRAAAECAGWNRGKKCPQLSAANKGEKNPMYGKTGRDNPGYKPGIWKTIEGVQHRKCSKCGEWKTLGLFHKIKGAFHGVSSQCKACHNRRTRDYKRCHLGQRARAKVWRTVNDVDERRCYKCREWKPFDLFVKNKNSFRGISPRCKDCHNKGCRESRRRKKK